MPASRSQANLSSTPRAARLVRPYSLPNRLPPLPDFSSTAEWYDLPWLEDSAKPDPPKPKFMTVEAMAAVVKQKRRQAQEAEQEYRKKALAAEEARLESNRKLVEYKEAKANLQMIQLMSPLDYTKIMRAMQQMSEAEAEWYASRLPQEPPRSSYEPRVSFEEERGEMVRYMITRWVRVQEDGVDMGDDGWTRVEEEVETTKDEMIRYYEANHQSASGSGSS